MTIIVSENNGVSLPSGRILGYAGENMLRTHRVICPKFEGAQYRLRLLFDDNTVREAAIEDGVVKVDSSMLSKGSEVLAQVRAVIEGEDGEEPQVFQSEMFTLEIGDAIIWYTGSVTP